MDLRTQIEKMASDITSGPDLSDSIEVGVVGAGLGALVGYLRDRSRESTKSFAMWGAGLGIGGQYLLFHMLRPSARARGAFMVGAGPEDCGPQAYWDDQQQACVQLALPSGGSTPVPQCPPGTFFDYFAGHCVSQGPKVGLQPGECPPGLAWDDVQGACIPAGLVPPSGLQPATGCPAGTTWSDLFAACVPQGIPMPSTLPMSGAGDARTGIQSGPAIVGVQSGPAIVGGPNDVVPPPLPATLSDWESTHGQCPPNQHLELHHGQFVCTPDQPSVVTSGVFRGGYRGHHSGMPYGPGPWPTNFASDPNDPNGG